MNFLEYAVEFTQHLPEVFSNLTTQPIGWLTLLLCVMISLAILSLVERLIKFIRGFNRKYLRKNRASSASFYQLEK